MPVANNETSTLDARRKLESVKLELDESIFFFRREEPIYMNLAVKETIENAVRSLYSGDHAPERSRSTLKILLELLSRTTVCSECNGRWFCQVDGFSNGSIITVTLSNILMKSFEYQIKSTKVIINKFSKNDQEACPECNRRVTYRQKESNVKYCENSILANVNFWMINCMNNQSIWCDIRLIARKITN